ncbi:MAG: hypothetical protein AAF531_10445 [Actinomycetota bacterium]
MSTTNTRRHRSNRVAQLLEISIEAAAIGASGFATLATWQAFGPNIGMTVGAALLSRAVLLGPLGIFGSPPPLFLPSLEQRRYMPEAMAWSLLGAAEHAGGHAELRGDPTKFAGTPNSRTSLVVTFADHERLEQWAIDHDAHRYEHTLLDPGLPAGAMWFLTPHEHEHGEGEW